MIDTPTAFASPDSGSPATEELLRLFSEARLEPIPGDGGRPGMLAQNILRAAARLGISDVLEWYAPQAFPEDAPINSRAARELAGVLRVLHPFEGCQRVYSHYKSGHYPRWFFTSNPGVWWLMEAGAALVDVGARVRLDYAPTFLTGICITLRLPSLNVRADASLYSLDGVVDDRPRLILPPTPASRLNRRMAYWERAVGELVAFFSPSASSYSKKKYYDSCGERDAWLLDWAKRWVSGEGVPAPKTKTGAPETKTRVPRPPRRKRTKRA